MLREADVPVLLAIGVAGVWALAYELHARRRDKVMARRKSSDFRQQATKEPYELELDSGEIVVFLDPNQIANES